MIKKATRHLMKLHRENHPTKKADFSIKDGINALNTIQRREKQIEVVQLINPFYYSKDDSKRESPRVIR